MTEEGEEGVGRFVGGAGEVGGNDGGEVGGNGGVDGWRKRSFGDEIRNGIVMRILHGILHSIMNGIFDGIFDGIFMIISISSLILSCSVPWFVS